MSTLVETFSRSIYVGAVRVDLVELSGSEGPYRYVVTTTTGYRAELAACGPSCQRPVCGKQPGHGTVKHDIEHCHALAGHRESALAFVEQVAATYGSARKERRRTSYGIDPRKLSRSAWARVQWTG